MKNTIFIFSGPAGAGKTTLWDAVSSRVPHIEKVITSTSRAMREKEIQGVHYHFLTKEQFEEKIAHNDLIEYATVHGNYYGSTYSELERILANNKSPIYIIEPQGMIHLRPLLVERGYTVKTIFVMPPSLEELTKRLEHRGSETKEEQNIRLETAKKEMEQQSLYDVVFINSDFEKSCEEFIQILV